MRIGYIYRVVAMAMVLASGPGQVLSEDIDLYVSGNASQNAPNVLIILDNTSNWSANSQKWTKATVMAKCGSDTTCQGYVNTIFGSNADLKQGQVEAGAIKLVLNELVCNTANPISVKVGLEFYAPDKGANGVNSVQAGYIRRAVTVLDQTNCSNVLADLQAIVDDITNPAFKSAASGSYGELLFEAFKYFGGYTDPTRAINDSPTTPNDGKGTPVARDKFGAQRYTDHTQYADTAAFVNGDKTAGVYSSPISSTNSCGKNYIVFVGNTWPNADNASLLSGLNGYSTTPICCGGGGGDRLADNWTKFLATTDVSGVSGQQPVFTYTLNVYQASADANQTKLLKSMAVNGGTGLSGYYEVNGDLKKLIDGLKDIFMSIAAVNSVFAAASLPVSVNTQGTYLNQVFVGMFRPDSDALQRWNGNLKQYKFAEDSATGTLYLADAKDQAAIDSANTGFIRQCAVSFWTADTSDWPVSGTPYWQRVPVTQTPEGACKNPPSDGTSSSFSPFSDWPDGNIVEKGGAAEWLRKRTCGASQTPTYCGRIIKTCATTACSSVVDFNSTNVTSISATLVNWVAGGNLGDGPVNASSQYQFYNGTTQSAPTDGLSGGLSYARPTIHGDVVHSRPLAVNYGTSGTNDVVVFYGAGDGALHAVDGNRNGATAGQELWAFIAPEFFGKFSRLRENTPKVAFPTVTGTPTPTPRDYFFDGAIAAYQERNGTGANSRIYIYPTMRRGGRMIYAFDATTRPAGTSATAPTLMWKFGCPNLTDDNDCIGTAASGSSNKTKIGQTWSTPRVVRVKGDSTLYLVFGGGYDSCEDVDNQVSGTGRCGASTKGQGVFVLNATTGQEVAYIDLTAIDNTVVAGRVVADVTPVDVNQDGYTDMIYVADTRGNLWRITTSTSGSYNGLAPASWTTARLAYVSDFSALATARKFLYAPDVVSLLTSNMVLIGTGDREHPLGTSSTATTTKNRFYGIRDDFSLAPPSSNINGLDCDTAGNTTLDAGCSLLDVTDTSLDYSSVISSAKGWVFKLATENSSTKEQVVTTPVTTGGVTYFSTFQPTDSSVAANQCSNRGTARGYAVNFLTGGLRSGDTSRQSIFTGGGLPPSPVAGVVELDNGKLVPFFLGGKCSGAECSALGATKPIISVPKTRKQVYRFQAIDTK